MVNNISSPLSMTAVRNYRRKARQHTCCLKVWQIKMWQISKYYQSYIPDRRTVYTIISTQHHSAIIISNRGQKPSPFPSSQHTSNPQPLGYLSRRFPLASLLLHFPRPILPLVQRHPISDLSYYRYLTSRLPQRTFSYIFPAVLDLPLLLIIVVYILTHDRQPLISTRGSLVTLNPLFIRLFLHFCLSTFISRSSSSTSSSSILLY